MNVVHRVWLIPEVVREVMRQSADNKETLVACARVSHALSEPALEILWEELKGMERLLSLLRKSIKTVDFVHEDTEIIIKQHVICGPIDDGEWARMQYYASLVRSYETFNERIDGITSATLLEKTGGTTLLPRLRHLRWGLRDECSSAFLLVLSSTLRDVFLDFRDFGSGAFGTPSQETEPGEYTSVAALRLIHSRSPHVEQLEVPCGLTHCTAAFLPSFEKLRHLMLAITKGQALIGTICHALPNLRSLNVVLAQPPEPAAPSQKLAPIDLGPVEQIAIGGHPKNITYLLDALHSSRLDTIRLASVVFDDAAIAHWASILATRFAHTLRDINFNIADNVNDATVRRFDDLFAGLYAVRGIESANFHNSHFETEIAVSADDVAHIAAAWPRLEYLCLPFVDTEDDEDDGLDGLPRVPVPRTPITALEKLAKGCPALDMLVMLLPDTAPLVELDIDTVPTYSNTLCRIDMVCGGWPEGMKEKAVAYLQRIFPRLREEDILTDEDWEN